MSPVHKNERALNSRFRVNLRLVYDPRRVRQQILLYIFYGCFVVQRPELAFIGLHWRVIRHYWEGRLNSHSRIHFGAIVGERPLAPGYHTQPGQCQAASANNSYHRCVLPPWPDAIRAEGGVWVKAAALLLVAAPRGDHGYGHANQKRHRTE